MAGRSFLKCAPNHAPNHKPPIQFQMLAACYYISFFLVHGISLIEIGARFKNDLPAIIRNKKRGGGGGRGRSALAPKFLFLSALLLSFLYVHIVDFGDFSKSQTTSSYPILTILGRGLSPSLPNLKM